MDTVEVIVEHDGEPQHSKTKPKTEESEAWFSCCSTASPADWASVVLISLLLSGVVAVIGTIILVLAYVVEPDMEQSLVSYYGMDMRIAGWVLLAIGAAGLFVGGGFTYKGVFKRPKIEEPTSQVASSSPTADEKQRY